MKLSLTDGRTGGRLAWASFLHRMEPLSTIISNRVNIKHYSRFYHPSPHWNAVRGPSTKHHVKIRSATTMAAQPAISSPSGPILRRSTTLPTKLLRPLVTATTNDAPPDPDDAAETLFIHPAARIVCFSASSNSYRSHTDTRSAAHPGLPWSSKTERVVAVGEPTPRP